MIGQIELLPINIDIENALLCDGSELLISEYPKLYEAIGNTFGDSGNENTFVIPSFTNEYMFGSDYSRIINEDINSNFLITNNQGNHSHTLYNISYGNTYGGWGSNSFNGSKYQSEYGSRYVANISSSYHGNHSILINGVQNNLDSINLFHFIYFN